MKVSTAAGVIALMVGVLVVLDRGYEIWDDLRSRPERERAVGSSSAYPLGVLGDSDSQAYHNIDSPNRFGIYSAVTFQWTEVLAQLRGTQLDLGTWGLRGTRRLTAEAMDLLWRNGHFPRKSDYQFSMAFGGAGCNSLVGYSGRQAARLAAEMDREPQRWRKGVVVIRIGINDLSNQKMMEALAKDSADPMVGSAIDGCLADIQSAVSLIHRDHPTTCVVLVGLLSNADDPATPDSWRREHEYANIKLGQKAFDRGLMRIAAKDKRIAFFDLATWWKDRWGERGEPGQADYKTVFVGPQRFPVRMTQGNDPGNIETQDAHLGVVPNTLFAQSLVEFINSSCGLQIAPITDDEVARYLEPAIELATGAARK